MLQMTAELNTEGSFFFQRFLFCLCGQIMLSYYIQVIWNDPNISGFSSPIFSGKFPEGDEIQLLIGDLFQFPSIFCVMLSCFVHQNFQIKYLNSLSNSVALALCPYHKLDPKRNLRACFDLGTFGWMWVPEATKRKIYSSFKTRQPSEILLTWEKTGVVCWKMRKPVEIGFSYTYFSLMLKNKFKSYGWKCEWIEVFFCCSVMSEFCSII